jgi:hypothetical protein
MCEGQNNHVQLLPLHTTRLMHDGSLSLDETLDGSVSMFCAQRRPILHWR